ncbi:hypothetical protein B0H13DRAFT_1867507 [Mycena leptocephala]|nr:hypothetical protein B0H13DRAFT_1867507 [Mycena leptocephala]
MTHSAIPAKEMSLFTKRRRAYVACTGCRKRKIKCVTHSDVDYSTCTRCSSKGLKCEYLAMPDGYSSSTRQPGTPPPEIQVPSRERNYSKAEWTPPPITPPSAGIGSYGVPGSCPVKIARCISVTPAHHPYRRRPSPPQPHHPHSSSEHLHEVLACMENHHTSRLRPDNAYYAEAPDAGYASGVFYELNYNQASLYVQLNGMAYLSPQAMQCICPPGPCYCGAVFNS